MPVFPIGTQSGSKGHHGQQLFFRKLQKDPLMMGAKDYLNKPYTATQLAQKIRTVLDAGKKKREMITICANEGETPTP